ncbi:MAG TPA: phage holin family protein [Gemmatimonadaceae bacterium]|nr:phage holin family protein [Gemmatimonadaceae bacterium]
MATHAMHVDADTTVPELIGRLSDDSKRLARGEVRLAKLEVGESLHRATRGIIRLALALAVGVVALVALTVLLTTLIGDVLIGHLWAGAVITGVLELAVGAWLAVRGARTLSRADYTLGESREELRATATWVARET